MATTQQRPSNERASAAASRAEEEGKHLLDDTICYLKEYAQENPQTMALWCFGIGFIVGWKLKPW